MAARANLLRGGIRSGRSKGEARWLGAFSLLLFKEGSLKSSSLNFDLLPKGTGEGSPRESLFKRLF